MLASPSKPSNTITRGGAAKGRAPDENIHLLVAKLSHIYAELDTDESNHLSDAGAETIAIELDRLEKTPRRAQLKD